MADIRVWGITVKSLLRGYRLVLNLELSRSCWLPIISMIAISVYDKGGI